MGLQDVFFQLRLPFDAPRPATLSVRIQEEIYFQALSVSCDLARSATARTPPSRRPGPPRASSSSTSGSTSPRDAARWDALRERIRRIGPAELAPGRHRADGDHRLDRRGLRVHRAADLEPVQARDALRRVPPGQPLPRPGAQGARPLDRGDPQPDQARRGIDPGDRRDPAATPRGLPHGLGDPDAVAHRHGGRPCAVTSTRASRSTCSSRARPSASSRRCTCTPGSKG